LGGLSHARATARAGRLFEELPLDQHNVFEELFVIDEHINTLTTIILSVEIVGPITRSQA
jgi:hypothetical protein